MIYRTESLYSAIAVGDGAEGTQLMFCVPEGFGIPFIGSAESQALLKPHQKTYTKLTTNLQKASEFNGVLRGINIERIRMTLEPVATDEVLQKNVSFQLEVGGEPVVNGPAREFADLRLKNLIPCGPTQDLCAKVRFHAPLKWGGPPFLLFVNLHILVPE